MTNKEIAKMFERHNLIRGYVYPYEGYRSEYWFERSPSNIANFIMQHSGAREIILTDTMDNLILNTMGEFIDRCPDQAFLQQILPHLIPMQLRLYQCRVPCSVGSRGRMRHSQRRTDGIGTCQCYHGAQ